MVKMQCMMNIFPEQKKLINHKQDRQRQKHSKMKYHKTKKSKFSLRYK